jgi:hypothetical protein
MSSVRRRIGSLGAVLLVCLAAAGCSSGPDKKAFVDEMTSKAAAGFQAKSFWGCVYDKTDNGTRSDLMDLEFSELGTGDQDLSRRVSRVMGECLGVDLSKMGSTTAPTTGPAPSAVPPSTTAADGTPPSTVPNG